MRKSLKIFRLINKALIKSIYQEENQDEQKRQIFSACTDARAVGNVDLYGRMQRNPEGIDGNYFVDYA